MPRGPLIASPFRSGRVVDDLVAHPSLGFAPRSVFWAWLEVEPRRREWVGVILAAFWTHVDEQVEVFELVSCESTGSRGSFRQFIFVDPRHLFYFDCGRKPLFSGLVTGREKAHPGRREKRPPRSNNPSMEEKLSVNENNLMRAVVCGERLPDTFNLHLAKDGGKRMRFSGEFWSFCEHCRLPLRSSRPFASVPSQFARCDVKEGCGAWMHRVCMKSKENDRVYRKGKSPVCRLCWRDTLVMLDCPACRGSTAENNPTSKFTTACDGCHRWFHNPCVGLKEGNTEGYWLCPQCRTQEEQGQKPGHRRPSSALSASSAKFANIKLYPKRKGFSTKDQQDDVESEGSLEGLSESDSEALEGYEKGRTRRDLLEESLEVLTEETHLRDMGCERLYPHLPPSSVSPPWPLYFCALGTKGFRIDLKGRVDDRQCLPEYFHGGTAPSRSDGRWEGRLDVFSSMTVQNTDLDVFHGFEDGKVEELEYESEPEAELVSSEDWEELREPVLEGAEEQWDVVIIGAGISGMSAYRTLLEKQAHLDLKPLKVLIVEARARVGGRMAAYKVESEGRSSFVDLGAQFMHGVDQAYHSMLEVARQSGTATVPVPGGFTWESYLDSLFKPSCPIGAHPSEEGPKIPWPVVARISYVCELLIENALVWKFELAWYNKEQSRIRKFLDERLGGDALGHPLERVSDLFDFLLPVVLFEQMGMGRERGLTAVERGLLQTMVIRQVGYNCELSDIDISNQFGNPVKPSPEYFSAATCAEKKKKRGDASLASWMKILVPETEEALVDLSPGPSASPRSRQLTPFMRWLRFEILRAIRPEMGSPRRLKRGHSTQFDSQTTAPEGRTEDQLLDSEGDPPGTAFVKKARKGYEMLTRPDLNGRGEDTPSGENTPVNLKDIRCKPGYVHGLAPSKISSGKRSPGHQPKRMPSKLSIGGSQKLLAWIDREEFEEAGRMLKERVLSSREPVSAEDIARSREAMFLLGGGKGWLRDHVPLGGYAKMAIKYVVKGPQMKDEGFLEGLQVKDEEGEEEKEMKKEGKGRKRRVSDKERELKPGLSSLFDGMTHLTEKLKIATSVEVAHVKIQNNGKGESGVEVSVLPAKRRPVRRELTSAGKFEYSAELPSQEERSRTRNLRSRYVICSLPIGVMRDKQRKGDFWSPPLSARNAEGIARVGAGVHNKVVLQYEEAFWPESFPLINTDDPRFQIFNQHAYSGNNTLVVHCFAPFGENVGAETENKSKVLTEVVRVISRMFPGETSKLLKTKITSWQYDPFSLCSYAYRALGCLDDSLDAVCRPHPVNIYTEASPEKEEETLGPSRSCTRHLRPSKEASEDQNDESFKLLQRRCRLCRLLVSSADGRVDPCDFKFYCQACFWKHFSGYAVPHTEWHDGARVFFCGEHTDVQGFQCACGARDSGIDAADDVLQRLLLERREEKIVEPQVELCHNSRDVA